MEKSKIQSISGEACDLAKTILPSPCNGHLNLVKYNKQDMRARPVGCTRISDGGKMEEELLGTIAVYLVLLLMLSTLIGWLLLSIGLFRLLKKSGHKQRWMAWFPGLRYAALGGTLGIPGEGIIAGLLEIAFFVLLFIGNLIPLERYGTLVNLLTLVALIALWAYRLRLFARLTTVFGIRRSWIILFAIVDWLAIMIVAFDKKIQPKRALQIGKEDEAGENPTSISGVNALHDFKASESGLSIDVRERSIKGLFKKVYLLKDIAMEIPNNSLVLLLGGSGCGKTTLINAIIGYEKADATILLNGSDVYKEYDRVKYRIGFVPQQNLIRGNDTVIRTIDDAALLRLPTSVTGKERDEKVQQVMDALGLTAGADGLVSKKSGGQLRRISIAMELITDPELFVLDEPDSGLDGVIARELFTKLKEIANEGKIVLVITHTPDRVIDLFDKVIVLARDSGRVGRLAFYGSPDEAKAFFGKNSMEEIVMAINRKDQGGEGLADYYIEEYAKRVAEQEQAAQKDEDEQ